MFPSKQNLFLFFEENEVQTVIDNKLVLRYANRCIIDEQAEFEICGVYQLQKVEQLMYELLHPLYKTNVNQRTFKEAIDRDTLTAALEKAYLLESKSADTHFIIGSSFHSVAVEKPTVINRPRKLIKWMSEEMKFQEITSVYITLLAGHRMSVITNEMNIEVYNGKMELQSTTTETPITFSPKFSVNDDFELSFTLIQLGRRLQQGLHLFFHPMLTPHELHLIKTKDESYLRSFQHHLGGLNPDVREEELKCFPDNDKKLRYVSCLCVRQSFHLK